MKTEKFFNGKILPISRGQETMMYGENYGEKDAKAILIEGRFLHGNLDHKRMMDCVRLTADNNEALRMICVKEDEKYFLQLKSEISDDDVFFTSSFKTEEEIRNDVMESVSHSMELSEGLFKARIYSISENEHILVAILHHIIADNITLSIVLSEIIKRYSDDGYVPTQAGKYSEFIAEEADFAASPEGIKQIDYWKNEMTDYIAPCGDGGGADFDVIKESSVSVDASELMKAAMRLKTSPFTLILAAAHLALGNVSNTDDTTLGIAFVNRTSKKYRGTVGYLSHMVQNRIRNVDRNNINGFVQAVVSKMSENLMFQRLSHYAKGSRVNIGMQGNPLSDKPDIFCGKAAEKVIFDFERNIDYFMIGAFPAENEYIVHLVCSPAVYSLDYVKRFVNAFQDAIKRIINGDGEII